MGKNKLQAELGVNKDDELNGLFKTYHSTCAFCKTCSWTSVCQEHKTEVECKNFAG